MGHALARQLEVSQSLEAWVEGVPDLELTRAKDRARSLLNLMHSAFGPLPA
jgi:hypothetical protein